MWCQSGSKGTPDFSSLNAVLAMWSDMTWKHHVSLKSSTMWTHLTFRFISLETREGQTNSMKTPGSLSELLGHENKPYSLATTSSSLRWQPLSTTPISTIPRLFSLTMQAPSNVCLLTASTVWMWLSPISLGMTWGFRKWACYKEVKKLQGHSLLY